MVAFASAKGPLGVTLRCCSTSANAIKGWKIAGLDAIDSSTDGYHGGHNYGQTSNVPAEVQASGNTRRTRTRLRCFLTQLDIAKPLTKTVIVIILSTHNVMPSEEWSR